MKANGGSQSKRIRDAPAGVGDFQMKADSQACARQSFSGGAESFSFALCGHPPASNYSNSFDLAGSSPSLRLPDMIDIIARDGQCLRWDESQTWYEVTNGPLLEEKLRCFQANRRDEASDRPFSKMHIHFMLTRGDRWGVTGSTFRPKYELPQKYDAMYVEPNSALPPLNQRSNVSMQYAPAAGNYQAQSLCFRSVLTEANPMQPDGGGLKRLRPSDDLRMPDSGQQAVRCPYPMTVSFSDALAARGAQPPAGACKPADCDSGTCAPRQTTLMQVLPL